MHDGVGLRIPDRIQDVALLFGFAQDKSGARIHSGAMTLGKIVVNRHVVTGIQEFFDTNRADVTRAARNENIHWLREYSEWQPPLNGEIVIAFAAKDLDSPNRSINLTP
jgi:hypothetical protein